MASIIKEILKYFPNNVISNATYEGANIVLYTNDKSFLKNSEEEIKKVVDIFKKRIELRGDKSILMSVDKAKEKILELIPTEANIGEIKFDFDRSLVIIEAEKPGVAIGKQGAILKEIKKKTYWTAQVIRKPPIKSPLLEGIKNILYEHSDDYKKFLNQVGERVYNGWIRSRKQEWVRIGFLGGAGQVGRSCLYLQTQESRILIDVGIDVSQNDLNAYPILDVPELNLSEIDAVIVSHSHLDHSGFVPALFRYGYRGPVYTTAPTRDVMILMQLDFIKIQLDAGQDPLYDADDVKNMLMHTIVLDYDEVTDVTPDVRITFHNAGHILGSSLVHVNIGNGLHNLLYSGDFKYSKTYLLDPAINKFQRVETIILESTYGSSNDIFKSRDELYEEFLNYVNSVISNNGKILIPVLGSGRAQEVMLILEDAINQGKIPKIPIYLDGMVWDITAIHTAYPEYLGSTLRNRIFNKNDNPFVSDIFKFVGSNKERQMFIEQEGPAVFIATSGMLTGGASVEYFKELADNPKNAILFVSYLAQNTLGRRILNGEKEFVFREGDKNRIVQVKCNVNLISGLSGHADRNEIVNFLKYMQPKPKRAFVIHGEYSKSKDLADYIAKKFNMEVEVPRNLDVYRLV
ncbi:MAG: beta-CASP ribonuclease aCPSF1 [Candidatus Woesearchaeota archaeon]